MKKQSATRLHTGMALQRSLVCNTSRCGWHTEQRQLNPARVTFDTQQHQLPLGPMLDARSPPVPPGRDVQVSEDLSMDLDASSLKRSRVTPSSTLPNAFADANEFAQKAQTAS